ncbi:penicillin acylase family protein [Promicromonospora thailandica]|uniref:Penicillin amidase n=1 Tax=Promicromonospora thailandica TaxID=765201 RepID=A0A9X2JXZ1_9MICO|nr:penicillin acylase family protein [Promicromonospora thailandica]MCP2264604.1 penicillin amidase [Promicromonospora thailandica]BFF20327.1 penicillin acylase family protein [Promicromonospora thailandica]
MVRQFLVGTAVVLVLVLVALTTFGWLTARRPLPELSGEVQLEGLSSDVRVSRDAQGVPQIYADSAEDLFRAQGYVHAQDRFFEMDYRRHVTAGRLAELVGNNEDAIQADKVIRTFGWRHVAEEEFNILDDATRQYLQAYADGVNAYLADRSPAETAVEYTVLDVSVEVNEPEPWDPIDSLAWLKAMAWDLRGNYEDELDRALAYSTLGDASRVAELFPAFSGTGNAPILDPAEVAAGQATQPVQGAENASATKEVYGSPALAEAMGAAQRALDSVPVQIARGEGTGSNSWAVSGRFTESGKPILANDPHLDLAAPGIWAQVGLHCNQVGPECPFDVSGFSFSGFPGVIIGHNADLAWGLTNMGADVTDFFIERVRNDTYLRGADEWVPMETETEVIRVDGGSPIDLEVRRTVHGPIISSVMGETDMDAVRGAPTETGTQLGQYEISLQWTALEPGHTADAVFAMNRARTPADMKAAAAQFEVPAQNIVFATTDGHIGYQAPGKIPVRASVPGAVESDGSWPRPGWDARYDWTGYVPQEQMPSVLDPKEGFVVAANQAVLPGGKGPFLTRDWDYGYRSERIRELLGNRIADGRKLSSADMTAIQMDQWSVFADTLVPVLLAVDLPEGYESDGQDLLADWDMSMDADSAAAAYFAAVWRNLLKITFNDELPETMWPDGGSRWLAVVKGMLDNPNDAFWDDKSTVAVVESRDQVLSEALTSARQDLTVELGKDTSDWEWGTLHQLRLEHLVLGGPGIPAPISLYVNPAPTKVGGGSSIVNATAWDASSGSFDVTSGPSMRMVVDMADLDASTWVVVTGTSAHPASAHYADQLAAWAAGETFPWPFSAEAVSAAQEDELILTP